LTRRQRCGILQFVGGRAVVRKGGFTVVQKKGAHVGQVIDRAAAAAIKAAAVQLSRLSDEELAEIEQNLDIAYLYASKYASKDGVSLEDWKHTAHYSTFTYAWVLAVLIATGERRRRKLIEQARMLEQVGA